jgi:hypothetical protein
MGPKIREAIPSYSELLEAAQGFSNPHSGKRFASEGYLRLL